MMDGCTDKWMKEWTTGKTELEERESKKKRERQERVNERKEWAREKSEQDKRVNTSTVQKKLKLSDYRIASWKTSQKKGHHSRAILTNCLMILDRLTVFCSLHTSVITQNISSLTSREKRARCVVLKREWSSYRSSMYSVGSMLSYNWKEEEDDRKYVRVRMEGGTKHRHRDWGSTGIPLWLNHKRFVYRFT